MNWKSFLVFGSAALFTVLLFLFAFKYAVASAQGSQDFFSTPELAGIHTSVMLYVTGAVETLPVVFTAREVEHLFDVRELFKAITIATYAVIALLLLSFLLLGDKQLLKKSLRIGVFGVFILLLVGVLVPFSTLFSLAHQPFFADGSWVFSQNSWLMMLYPETFFFAMARVMVLFLVVASIATLLIQYFLNGSGGGGTGG